MSEFPGGPKWLNDLMNTRPVLYVDLKQAPLSKLIPGWGLPGRPQRWRWVARNASNHKVMARSSERYTNKQDCLDAISQLFSPGTTVYLRQAEHGDECLRLAT
jgi:uncharacterized protein YegP (UPF0339 family)